VHAIRNDRRARSAGLFLATIALGALFLGVKLAEYAKHMHEGIYPGGYGSYFLTHDAGTRAPFWTLYYVMTGLHAIHVVVGMALLSTVVVGILRGAIVAEKCYRADLGAMYWHLIDLIWIFLWPLFYLA
jgi:cytochrome c oxidase subunit 3